MSVTLMAASCDSIGSCSLDVDAESIVDSLTEATRAEPPINHPIAGGPTTKAASLSKQTLHSFLLSASAESNNPENNVSNESNTGVSSPSTAKKPSYLNLACSISGYGGITTYDSKLREGFRSRDHSPGRLVGIQSNSRESSPARGESACRTSCGNFLTAPSTGRHCWTSPASTVPSGAVDMKHVSSTFCGAQQINGTNGSDQTDAAGNFSIHRFAEQRNRWLESTLSPPEKNRDFQNVVSVIQSNSENQHGFRTETVVETKYESSTRSHSTKMSTTVISSASNSSSYHHSKGLSERTMPISFGSTPARNNGHMQGQSESETRQSIGNGSAIYQTPVSSKSFIQQRVERLYGPCALAQGFFRRSGNSKSPAPYSIVTGEVAGTPQDSAPGPCKLEQIFVPDKHMESSTELPVLRHLRPEFRDQLPVAPRRSLGSRFSSSPANVETKKDMANPPALQHQTSTESLADLQPAAPEVVLPQAVPPQTPKIDLQPQSAKNQSAASDHVNGSVSSSEPVEEVKEVPKIEEEDANALASNLESVQSNKDVSTENVGHKFLKIQRETIEKLLELAKGAETHISESGVDGNPVLSEEALGHLRAAAGQARLLVTQKMVQFEGLCRKCINQHPEEPFPTTPEDLQGFWDMLLLQVDQVHRTFSRLENLKAVGWCEDKLPPQEERDVTDSPTTRAISKRTSQTPKQAPAASAKAAEAAAARKQREQERRKMMEQRRKELKLKQQQQQQDTDDSTDPIEIFPSQSS